MTSRRLLPGTLAFACVWSTTSLAVADPIPQDRAAARALFDEGRSLARAGRYSEACPKFEESQRLEGGIGTLFNLADCYEHVGRTASAWSDFLEVADAAKRSGEGDRERVARGRAEQLAVRLARVTFVREDAATAVQVKLDGTVLGEGAVGAGLPIDPGTHTVEAIAPGKKSWSLQIEVRDGQAPTVTIPRLQDEPVAPSGPPAALTPPVALSRDGTRTQQTQPPALEHESSRPWQRPLGIGLSAAGAVGLGIGSVFGLLAQGKWSDAKPQCGGGTCSPTGYAEWNDAKSSATVSTVFFIAGAVVMGAGVAVWITAPGAWSARVALKSDRVALDVEF